MILAQNRITVLTLVVVALFTSCAPEGSEIMPSPDSHVLTPVAERVPTVGFDEVTKARDGEYVTLTEHIDVKYLCMDVSATQKEICTTALVNSNHQPFHVIEIRLRVCSESRRRNCILFPSDPRNRDFRDIYVLDQEGEVIDFDGHRLIEPPNTWTADSVRVKLTGRVTVVNGKGMLLEPIERIESE